MGTRFKIERVKGHATPAPDGGRAAQPPVPVLVGWAMELRIRHLAGIQQLGLLVRFQKT
jgi:hypothetical protein